MEELLFGSRWGSRGFKATGRNKGARIRLVYCYCWRWTEEVLSGRGGSAVGDAKGEGMGKRGQQGKELGVASHAGLLLAPEEDRYQQPMDTIWCWLQ